MGKRKNCLFSFSHSVFKRIVLQTSKNQESFGKGLNSLFLTTLESSLLKTLQNGNKHFSFPHNVSYSSLQVLIFESHLCCCLQMLWIWSKPKFWWGNLARCILQWHPLFSRSMTHMISPTFYQIIQSYNNPKEEVLKTMNEKQKMLLTSIPYFSTWPFNNLLYICKFSDSNTFITHR